MGSDAQGFPYPYMISSWYNRNDVENVSSAAYVNSKWAARADEAYAKYLTLYLPVASDAGTTGKVQVLVNGGVVGTELDIPAGSAYSVKQFVVQHGISLLTGPVDISIQAKRAAGAGNVAIYQPVTLHWGQTGLVASKLDLISSISAQPEDRVLLFGSRPFSFAYEEVYGCSKLDLALDPFQWHLERG
jgi:hypothetical protein